MKYEIKCSNFGNIKLASDFIKDKNIVSLGIWLPYGSVNEPVNKNGLAHFLEHMLFKGTKNLSSLDIVKNIEIKGGILNAFTTKELICIHVTILNESFEDAFKILSDMIQNSVFNENEIKKEKEVVLEEINGVFDTPEEFIEDKFSENLFKYSPLSNPILGTPETLKHISRNDLVKTIDKLKLKNGLVITTSGGISHKTLFKATKTYFKKIDSSFNSLSNISTLKNSGKFFIKRSLTQSHIMVGFQTKGYSSSQRNFIYILHLLLGAGMSSTMFQILREELGLAYNLYSFYEFYNNCGMFSLYFATEPKKREFLLKNIYSVLNKLSEFGINEDKLQELKLQFKGLVALKYEKISERMLYLGRQILYNGNVENFDEIQKGVSNISAQNINEFLAINLKKENFVELLMEK